MAINYYLEKKEKKRSSNILAWAFEYFLYFCIHIQNFSSQEGEWFKLKMATASPLKSEGPLSLIYVYATFNIEKKRNDKGPSSDSYTIFYR